METIDKKMKKIYVLDTNVLLSDPDCLNSFEEHDLIIPLSVLEELDRHKSRSDEVGRNARQISRTLDGLREKGSLFSGVKIPTGATLRVVAIDSKSNLTYLPVDLRDSKVDNMIIALMMTLRNAQDTTYILVSKDINVRLKCDSLGVKCEDYRKTKVVDNLQKMYRGVEVIEVEKDIVDLFYETQVLEIKNDKLINTQLFPNQIIVIKATSEGITSASAITRYDSAKRCLVPIKKYDNAFGLKPRNKEQIFSLDLLFDPNIKLITMTGAAGCVVPDTIVKTKIICKDRNIPYPADTYDNEYTED